MGKLHLEWQYVVVTLHHWAMVLPEKKEKKYMYVYMYVIKPTKVVKNKFNYSKNRNILVGETETWIQEG